MMTHLSLLWESLGFARADGCNDFTIVCNQGRQRRDLAFR